MSTTYNGWTNYETWNANLWMDNDGMSEQWAERAEELVRGSDGDREEATRILADEMDATMDEFFPEVQGMFADLLRAACQEIDWREIAGHYVDDVEYTPDEEEAA